MNSTRYSKSNLTDSHFSQVDTPEASDDEDLIVITEKKQNQVIVIIDFTLQQSLINLSVVGYRKKNFYLK